MEPAPEDEHGANRREATRDELLADSVVEQPMAERSRRRRSQRWADQAEVDGQQASPKQQAEPAAGRRTRINEDSVGRSRQRASERESTKTTMGGARAERG